MEGEDNEKWEMGWWKLKRVRDGWWKVLKVGDRLVEGEKGKRWAGGR